MSSRDGYYKAIKLQPDVILSDVQMPVLSGDQMVLKLRSTAQTQQIPVVLLTARADEALRLRMVLFCTLRASSLANVSLSLKAVCKSSSRSPSRWPSCGTLSLALLGLSCSDPKPSQRPAGEHGNHEAGSHSPASRATIHHA
jgi:hypothetical protein